MKEKQIHNKLTFVFVNKRPTSLQYTKTRNEQFVTENRFSAPTFLFASKHHIPAARTSVVVLKSAGRHTAFLFAPMGRRRRGDTCSPDPATRRAP